MNETLFAQLVTIGAARNIEVTYEDVPGQAPRKRLGYVLSIGNGSYECYGYHLGPVTDEILTDLITYFENVEDVMNIYSTDLFTYMAGDMIGQSTITLTIAGVTMENMNSGKGGAQSKPCLHFKERSKLMVLNKTNAKVLAAELGPETDNWIGARVTIAAPVVDAFGKSARSLRVIKVEQDLVPAAPRPVARPVPAPSPQPSAIGPLPDDEQAVVEAAPADYLTTVANLLNTDETEVKAHLAALGYSGVPKSNEQRLSAYVALKANAPQPQPAQDDLFSGPEFDARRAAALATAQGRAE